MKYAKVNGYPNLLRDLDTNAIINVDSTESTNYDRLKRKKILEKTEINKMKEDIEDLKKSIDKLSTIILEFVSNES
jgi:hypothetical protein